MPARISDNTKEKVLEIIKREKEISITNLLNLSKVNKYILDKVVEEFSKEGIIIIIKLQFVYCHNGKETISNQGVTIKYVGAETSSIVKNPDDGENDEKDDENREEKAIEITA